MATGSKAVKNPPEIADNTPEEEAEIQRNIAEDPDTWATPAKAKVVKRGHPLPSTVEQVTVGIDRDVLEALKTPEAEGWQGRLNQALRRALQLDTATSGRFNI